MDYAEVWRDVPYYHGLYQVSNKGRVWSVRRQRYLTPIKHSNGYLQVHLSTIYGKHKHEYIHRLVALAFIPNPNNYPQVNHKDENKENNCVGNLEWCTVKYNANYGTRIERCVKAFKEHRRLKKHES